MYDGDYAAFRRASARLWAEAQECEPDELTAAVEQIVPILGKLHGTFSSVAVLVGAFVESGAAPLSLSGVLPERAVRAMDYYQLFFTAWGEATGGQPLPDRNGSPTMTEVVDTLVADAKRRGLSEDAARSIALSWFDLEHWLKPMITLMAIREFRDAMTHRDEVRAGAAAITKGAASAEWVHGLALVLDDEPLIVLDPVSGSGFRLTISGVGDNFQLHTLVADRVTGAPEQGLLAGVPPEPAWVTAATDGAPGPFSPEVPILRRFRMFDGHGAYIYPEGRPSDIEPLDGTRVVVLHPPNGNYGWQNGRTYSHMTPTVTLDQVMTQAGAADWLARISPARETDMMASPPREP